MSPLCVTIHASELPRGKKRQNSTCFVVAGPVLQKDVEGSAQSLLLEPCQEDRLQTAATTTPAVSHLRVGASSALLLLCSSNIPTFCKGQPCPASLLPKKIENECQQTHGPNWEDQHVCPKMMLQSGDEVGKQSWW